MTMSLLSKKHYLLFSLLLLLSSCDDQVIASDEADAEHEVNGTLTLYLHKRQPIGLFVNFQLRQFDNDGVLEKTLLSQVSQIESHPVAFSLSVPSSEIVPDKTYRLKASVSEDAAGVRVIAGMTRQVFQSAKTAELHMVIKPLPLPIE